MKALITGGTRSIGKGIALAFAQAGADVVVGYRSDAGTARATVEELQAVGVRANAVQADIGDAEERERLVREAVEFLGGLNVLVNNAGFYAKRPFLDTPLEEFEQQLQVDAVAPIHLMQMAASHMSRGDAIVNISSIAARRSTVNGLSLCSAKAALNRASQAVALELGPEGIRCNVIELGMIDSESNLPFKEGDPQGWAKAVDRLPLKRAGLPTDAGSLAVFLASDASKWTTGSIVRCDGGHTLILK